MIVYALNASVAHFGKNQSSLSTGFLSISQVEKWIFIKYYSDLYISIL